MISSKRRVGLRTAVWDEEMAQLSRNNSGDIYLKICTRLLDVRDTEYMQFRRVVAESKPGNPITKLRRNK